MDHQLTKGNEMEIGKNSADACAVRQSIKNYVEEQMRRHQREFAAWRYINSALHSRPPEPEVEEALWLLLTRTRHGNY